MFHHITHLVFRHGNTAAGKGFVRPEAVHKERRSFSGYAKTVIIDVQAVLIMLFVINNMFAVFFVQRGIVPNVHHAVILHARPLICAAPT